MDLKLNLKGKSPLPGKQDAACWRPEGKADKCQGSEIENSLFRGAERRSTQLEQSDQGAEQPRMVREMWQGLQRAGPWMSGKDHRPIFILKTVRSQRKLLSWEQHYSYMGSRNSEKEKKEHGRGRPRPAFPSNGILTFWHRKHIF